MGKVFVGRAQATKHAPAAGDTLGGIVVSHYDPAAQVTWKDVAIYNFGTDDPAIVNQSLSELVGVGTRDPDPSKSVLDPARGPAGEILLPALWRAPSSGPLVLDKSYTIKVRAPKPPPRVRITRLSSWFLPELETCDLSYALDGAKELASRVEVEIRASNHAKATATAEGSFHALSFAACDDLIWRRRITDAAVPGETKQYSDWKGESEATDGILKPPAKGKRYIDVVGSPYNVLLRYFKEDADKNASIVLKPFWPAFKDDGSPVPASLKVSWKVAGCGRLKQGVLLLWDKDGREVFVKGLAPALLSQGDHELDLSADAAMPALQAASMPYRIQIQAHTDPLDEKGVAVAAMHSEVRLYVAPTTKPVGVSYDPKTEPASLTLTPAPLVPGKPPKKSDELIWAQHQLALAGFHPGPVDGKKRTELEIAVKEFQRAVPKSRVLKTSTFERMKPDGKVTSDVVKRLDGLRDSRKLPWFGKAADLGDLTDEKEIERTLADPAATIVGWIADRQYYTQTGLGGGGGDASIDGHEAALGNPRGQMDIGDERVTRDAETIPRPWYPLQVVPRILTKARTLADDVPVPQDPVVLAAMRRAVGPVRVDWSINEPDPDLDVIDAGRYDKVMTRTRRAVELLRDSKKTVHTQKDGRAVEYRNCPLDLGGIRPASAADYFKAAFGLRVAADNNKSLAPWMAKPDSTTETVVTVAHGDLGQGAEHLFEPLVGAAGAFFNPSRIAGDGYRVRAQVRFAKLAGHYDHPNVEVLAARYPALPQAGSCVVRMWRKSSLRGYFNWSAAATGHWPAFAAPFNQHYHPAHVHFVHEGGAEHTFDVRKTFDPTGSGLKRLREIMRAKVNVKPFNVDKNIKPSAEHVYPWWELPGFGMKVSNPNETLSAYLDRHHSLTWRKYREALLFEFTKAIEKKDGLLRGHVFAEFKASPGLTAERYRCVAPPPPPPGPPGPPGPPPPAVCGKRFFWLAKQGVSGELDDTECPSGCGGRLAPIPSGGNPRTLFNRANFPFAAVGSVCGATWLFVSGSHETWAHEVGHHRHLQHAASAPGFAPAQHDSIHNPANWAGWLKPDGTPKYPDADDQQWDHACIMSYTPDSERLHFCGKCVLKTSGWKVEGLANPAGNEVDP